MTTALNVYEKKKIVGNPDYPVRDAAAIDINQVAASRPPVPFGYKPATTAGLNFGYYGGEMWVDGVLTNIADGTLALTAATTNYVEADRTGAISKNTVGFSAGKTPLYEITTDGGSITLINDRRIGNAPITGRLALDVAGGAGDTVLTAAQARNDILEFTGALTGARNIIVPAVPKKFVVYNNTSGAYSLTVKTAAGAGIAVTQGKRALVYCDGTDVVAGSSDVTGFAALAGATFTGGINEARGSVAMHPTTMDLWAQPNIIDGTGSAVTITAVANAPQAGARRTLFPPTGTTITHGATFNVEGGATYVTQAGDGLVFEAKTISTYNVWLKKAAGWAVTFASAAENAAGTASNTAVDPLGIREAFNATGSAPVYACRAWVNFNGTGAVAIRASGNISSITDGGTGTYTVNFTTALPDANYVVLPSTTGLSTTDPRFHAVISGTPAGGATVKSTSQCTIITGYPYGATLADAAEVDVAFFR